MYCPHCSKYIVDYIGDDDSDYTSASESYSWSDEESDLQTDWNYDGFAAPVTYAAPQKRPRPADSFTDLHSNRPLKRARTEDVMDVDDKMDVDSEMHTLTGAFRNLSINK